MGWVKQTIGKGRDVNGVIVARSINDRLRYAVSVVPNVSLFEYKVKFDLRPAHEFPDPVQEVGASDLEETLRDIAPTV
jgi:hypothetical protein